MRVDAGLISYLEELSCLALSEEEKRRFTEDLDKILGYMARLSEIDTRGVPACSLFSESASAFREDVVTPSLERGLLLQNASASTSVMFVAPRTV